ncbi:MAG: ABC transporter permease [Bacteroidota bacterium]
MNGLQFIWEGFRIAINAIGANRMRSFLTMLGVATGIFVITSILTMVNTLQETTTKSIAELGNTTMFVHHFPWDEEGEDWKKFFNRPKVSYRDYQFLQKSLRGVDAIAYQITAAGQTIKQKGQSASGVEVVGVTEEAAKIGKLELEDGRYFSGVEFFSGAPVCVIGYSIAENLFPDTNPLGNYVQVKSKRLKVIGILAKKGKSIIPGMASDDERVLVPWRVMPSIFNLNSRRIDKTIIIQATDYENLGVVESDAIGILRASRGLSPKIENNFAINKQEMLMNRFDSAFGYLETGGWVISAFSILIGVFSIGMIMYISVRERTNEIGVQKALGSTKSFILYQFVMEAILICLIGGMIGLMIVFGLGALVEVGLKALELDIEVITAQSTIMIAIFLSAGIGLLAGFIPALIAALMDPVEAIRFN